MDPKNHLEIIDKIFKTLRDNAYTSSSDIAKEKGSFPKYNKEKYLTRFPYQEIYQKKLEQKLPNRELEMRFLLTIAPTGSTSLLSGVSSGIEPVYEFEFTRRDRLG